MIKIIRTERGWCGHLIVGNSCKFRRNTLLDNGIKKIVVSTVGAYVSPLYPNEFTEIGHNRYYETMVFEATLQGKYWDADVCKEIKFDSKWQVSTLNNNSDNEANEMHEDVLKEIITIMEKENFND